MPFDQVYTLMNTFDCLAFVPDEEIKFVRNISTNLNKPSLYYKIIIFDIFKKKNSHLNIRNILRELIRV